MPNISYPAALTPAGGAAYDATMFRSSFETRRRHEGLARAALADHQLSRLNQLLAEILPANRFYADKLAQVQLPLSSLAQLADLPFTYKEELVDNSRTDRRTVEGRRLP